MNARRILAIKIARRPRETERCWNANARRAGRKPNERHRRCRMSIEWFCTKFLEQRCGRCWIAAKPKKIFEPQLEFLIAWQQIRRGDSRHFVAKGPHCIQSERFVP